MSDGETVTIQEDIDWISIINITNLKKLFVWTGITNLNTKIVFVLNNNIILLSRKTISYITSYYDK